MIESSSSFTLSPDMDGGPKLTVYFKNSISTLNNYFKRNYDSCLQYLESVDFSNFDSSEVTSLYYLFDNCPRLKNVRKILIHQNY